MKLVLPYPPRELNPNARVHFHKKAPIVRKAKQDAFYVAFQHRGLFSNSDRLRAVVRVYSKTAAPYDTDNMLANCKAYYDGIFEGLGINDTLIDDNRCIRCGVDKFNPRVEITIEPISIFEGWWNE